MIKYEQVRLDNHSLCTWISEHSYRKLCLCHHREFRIASRRIYYQSIIINFDTNHSSLLYSLINFIVFTLRVIIPFSSFFILSTPPPTFLRALISFTVQSRNIDCTQNQPIFILLQYQLLLLSSPSISEGSNKIVLLIQKSPLF